jgi:hypothetical protein
VAVGAAVEGVAVVVVAAEKLAGADRVVEAAAVVLPSGTAKRAPFRG